MKELPDDFVQCVTTSPPYWGLRKYAGDQDLIWDGDPSCVHEWGEAVETGDNRFRGENALVALNKNEEAWAGGKMLSRFCRKCGAWRGAFGHEPLPEMYVDHTVQILREIRRVLRPDGVVFWNIGETYAGYWGDKKALKENRPSAADGHGYSMNSRPKYDEFRQSGIKPKDMCLIPFRVALEAQRDGWWVRSVIIWDKANPMPESVRDRPTESHEYILMLVKGQWSSTTIKFSDIADERIIFTDDFIFKKPDSRTGQICIKLASTILNCTNFQQYLSLSLFNPEIRQQYLNAVTSPNIINLPSEQRISLYASSFMSGNTTTKEFLEQINSFITSLGNRDIFLIGRGSTMFSNTPTINADGNRTITIQNAGEICKFDFIHNLIIVQKPTTCKYYWDQEAVREEYTEPLDRWGGDNLKANGHSTWDQGTGQTFYRDRNMLPNEAGRNIRSVWKFATQPYPEAHFAVFPEKLPEICIKAATPEMGSCPKCGKPWTRVIEKGFTLHDGQTNGGKDDNSKRIAMLRQAARERGGEYVNETKTVGWEAGCECNTVKPPVPAVVLDPFAGSGTVLWVAKKLNRKAVAYEISEEYCRLIRQRNQQQVGL